MKEFFKNIKFINKYSKNERNKIILYFIVSMINIFIGIALPFISAEIIIKLTDNNIYQFLYIGIISSLIEIIYTTLSCFNGMLAEKIFKQVCINIQLDLSNEILKLNCSSLEENSTGVFMERLINDTKNIATIFTDLNMYVSGIIGNIGILIAYFISSKTLFTFILIAFVIRLIIENIRINKYNKNKKEYKKYNDLITGFTSEVIKGAIDIKMLNSENSFLNELRKKFDKTNNKKYKMEVKNFKFQAIRAYWSNISYFLIMLIIGLEISNNKMKIPMGVALFNLGNKYNNFVKNITGIYELIKDFNLSSERILEIFNEEKYKKEKFGNKHITNIKGNFEFKNVTFKYDKNVILDNLNFKVNANETVAFVGRSGAGKTTIFNLLCKLYDTYDGIITIDNIDIKQLDKDSIRNNITIVSQNPYIFNMSIKDNIKLVKSDATDSEIKNALSLACLDEYIESLPLKYDTIVGEGGINLSGGQRQRLAIARAFIQKTEIILFDEATSALDNETQAKIQKSINNLKKNCTILIIAHRLSTILNANKIYVIDNGKIIDCGSHGELLERCKLYKKLYESEISKSQ